jgi:mersacidin/lichenicidin family type 2 lantibiotic
MGAFQKSLVIKHYKGGNMSQKKIIRAWKDIDFRNSLSAKERAFLPENPAGLLELTDAELGAAAGGGIPPTVHYGCTHRSTCF